MTDEYEYYSNKRPDKIYLSSAFPEAVATSDGEVPQTLRILSMVVDGGEGLEYAQVKKEIVLRRTLRQRQELKVCFVETSRQVRSITFQKFTVKSGTPHKCSFTFTGDEIGKLYDVLEFVKYAELESGEKQRIDETVVSTWRLSEQEKMAFLRQQITPGILKEIIENDITLLDVVTIAQRKRQLELFEQLLKDESFFDSVQREWRARGPEDVWQKYFESNPWIFGYGLRYVFMTGLDDRKLEQITSGNNFYQAGKRVDSLLKTQGYINALCFVEIKTHRSPLLAGNAYRPECWGISTELAGGVAQIQKTVKKVELELRSRFETTSVQGDPTGEIIFAYTPKSYVVIGSLAQFKTPNGINDQKYSSFELFRRSLVNPEIITFDELYERARFIVAQSEVDATEVKPLKYQDKNPTLMQDENIPF